MTDCRRRNHSKTADFQLSCQVLIFLFFSLQNEALSVKILHPEIQESEFSAPSKRPQMSRRDYSSYDQKVAKVSGLNSDT